MIEARIAAAFLRQRSTSFAFQRTRVLPMMMLVNAKEVSNGTYAIAQCPDDRCSVFVCGVDAVHLMTGRLAGLMGVDRG